MYIYPDNLKSKAVLWLWQLRDIGIGCLISVFALAQLGILIPIVATAREFLIIIRLKDEKQKEIFPYLNRIEKTLREQGFSVKQAGYQTNSGGVL